MPQVAVPPDARALSTLSRIDYEDAFLAETDLAQERTPEQWTRAILEDAPEKMRRLLRGGWSALGLQLASTSTRSNRYVLGWEVRRSTADVALLAAGSRLGLRGEVLLMRKRHALLCATFVTLENPAARAVWAGVAPGHRQVVPRLLEQAVARHGVGGDPEPDDELG